METKTLIKFDVTPEIEKRYTISKDIFQLAVKSGVIKIREMVKIEQRWIMGGERYTGRIRKTSFFSLKNPIYEHTVKHHVGKSLDYEITTDINLKDYELLSGLYKDVAIQSKLRIYVIDQTGDYDGYTITVDIPDDKPNICWVEIESNNPKDKKVEFKKPKWIQETDG